MRLARTRGDEAVPKGPNDGSQARSAWESAIKHPSRRVLYDWLLFRRFGCARRLLLRGNPSRRTLRDGGRILNAIPGPATAGCLATIIQSLRDASPIPASILVAGFATHVVCGSYFRFWG